ncbi:MULTISPECIES: hypothetical protein [Halobacteriales]|uniref:DUF7344 domain-containing protein n=1 Tax=Halosimplex aquaticum TaxID=3026162 RepID=A0ABD5Y4L2_9EURY|nr:MULTISPECIES: hypothetical protein [Halobacteriales]QDX41798.1 hypothetical protein FQU85_13120 [Salarchaeum sp. JOR-1]
MSVTEGYKPAEVHALLGNQRRFLVVEYLSMFDSGVDVEVRHVARVIRAVETGTPPHRIGADEYESAYNGLIQRHLPRLASAGLVEYDEQRKEIRVTDRLNQYAMVCAFTKSVSLGEPDE